jgi:hypothetical protein
VSSLRQNVAHPRGEAQLTLWTPAGKYEAQYLEHRRAHPQVFDELVAAAREARARGWKKLGIRAIWERMRWRRGPKPLDSAGFHMNDHLTAYYAREIVASCPDLVEMFELRTRTNPEESA